MHLHGMHHLRFMQISDHGSQRSALCHDKQLLNVYETMQSHEHILVSGHHLGDTVRMTVVQVGFVRHAFHMLVNTHL